MKISKLFHWLYACVMFLPLLVIPIFAIYTINHENNENIVVEKSVNEVINYNQYLSADATYTENYYFDLTTEDLSNINYQIGYGSFDIVNTHKYYLRMTAVERQNANGYFLFGANISGTYRYKQVSSSSIFNFDYSGNYNFSFVFSVTADTSLRYFRCYLGLYDLTQMFGLGNEPTISEFETYFPNLYYSYSLGKNITISVGTELFNDTDIGSQYLYSVYHITDKYFNFDNVFNLGAITKWLDTNVFNGATPLGFTIVWHYLDYWLLVSIFWLCFDVLIYVPQLAHRWLDKASLE